MRDQIQRLTDQVVEFASFGQRLDELNETQSALLHTVDRLTAEESEGEDDDQSSQGVGSASILDMSRAPGGPTDSVASPQLRRVPMGEEKTLFEEQPKFMAAKGQTGNPKMGGYSEEEPPSIFVSSMPGEGSGGVGGVAARGGGTAGMVGMGQMKLDPPPRYNGNRRPGPRPWLASMERYMRLMRYPTHD